MKSLPMLYCDMDGVLADFKKAAEKVTGLPVTQWQNSTKSEKWNPIRNKKDFWETLPWTSDGKSLWNYIKKYKPHILSAYVDRSVDPNCISGKTKWARRNLGLEKENEKEWSTDQGVEFEGNYESSLDIF